MCMLLQCAIAPLGLSGSVCVCVCVWTCLSILVGTRRIVNKQRFDRLGTNSTSRGKVRICVRVRIRFRVRS